LGHGVTPDALDIAREVARHFRLGGSPESVTVFSGGHINRSYLVATDAPARRRASSCRR
jgi:hypothetical protein